jgi:hypothetical protein
MIGDLEFALQVSKTQKDLENFRIWFSELEISTLGRGKFKDMVFRTWFSRLEISTLRPRFSHSRFPRPKPENF